MEKLGRVNCRRNAIKGELQMMDKQIIRVEKELDFICNQIIKNLDKGVKNGINEREFWGLVDL